MADANITGCQGRILSISRKNQELLGGDKPIIPFTKADAADALSKTVYSGVPEYLDILAAERTHGIMHTMKGNRSELVDWKGMFVEEDSYYITIAVTSNEASTAEVKLKFDWTKDPATSIMTALS
ncbi:hypothetical protein [Bradyrhizobium sp. Mp64]|uniref:hypothetical protein n=1 Tax=Bradyrhizobium sp. Mp64 TaxID=3042158 RepID=UPI00248C0F33|nr:hypothetical protein [Bradyrhizobium sp. Mp64]MDI2103938.1 hypothetical protein [Bradyrhizobium sp. Mp64]